MIEKLTERFYAGTWIWWIEANKLIGDDVVADLFNLDRDLLKEGAPIETVREAIHPDDLQATLDGAQASIDDRSPYRARFRVRRRDGLVREVMAVGQCFFEDDRIVQFVGTTMEIAPATARHPTLDQLTAEVIAACDTARALNEPFRLHLLEMVLKDIGTATAKTLDLSPLSQGDPAWRSH
ncbi:MULTISPECIES: PAS domain-containing protein [unclassified Aureimonas]|uniref:PAS domain-containing protein n=1 Tax=unclassified Aureimonas TaxID=2615206 RepID=UPI0006F7D444|nr:MULTISPECIES: PAS domain-containing protein [unclassified Aureimonas]KQT60551.1 hypothetical protein ASG62_07885 [Aureimonas sp. Leaf427]KQT79428.1 hypothetical protein ASG54_10485 [Aureimonas sp. Leaf460]